MSQATPQSSILDERRALVNDDDTRWTEINADILFDQETSSTFPVRTVSSEGTLQTVTRKHTNNSETTYFSRYADSATERELAMELIQNSPAVLVKTQPSVVDHFCGTERVQATGSFLIGIPEVGIEGNLVLENVTPLSVANDFLYYRNEAYSDGESCSFSLPDSYTETQKGALCQYIAYSRHRLRTHQQRANIPSNLIDVVCAADSLNNSYHIIESSSGYTATPGKQFDTGVDIAVSLSHRNALIDGNSVPFVRLDTTDSCKNSLKAVRDIEPQASIQYNTTRYLWECNLNEVRDVIQSLIAQPSVETVSLHRVTAMYLQALSGNRFGAPFDGIEEV